MALPFEQFNPQIYIIDNLFTCILFTGINYIAHNTYVCVYLCTIYAAFVKNTYVRAVQF